MGFFIAQNKMNLVEKLEQMAEEELCHECHNVLSEDELALGYLCRDCIDGWCEDAYHGNSKHFLDELGI